MPIGEQSVGFCVATSFEPRTRALTRLTASPWVGDSYPTWIWSTLGRHLDVLISSTRTVSGRSPKTPVMTRSSSRVRGGSSRPLPVPGRPAKALRQCTDFYSPALYAVNLTEKEVLA